MSSDMKLPADLREYLKRLFPFPLSPKPTLAELLADENEPERMWADTPPDVRLVMDAKALFYRTPCDPLLSARNPDCRWLCAALKRRHKVVNLAQVRRQKKWTAEHLDIAIRLNEISIYVVNLACDEIMPISSIPRTPWDTLDLEHCLMLRADVKKLSARKVSDDKTKGHRPRTRIKEWLKDQSAEFDKLLRPEQIAAVKSSNALKDIFQDEKGPGDLTVLEYIKTVRGTRK